MAANSPQLIESTLMDAVLEGIAVISKKKLLWMLGWTNDKPNAWAELQSHWERMGRDPALLQCATIGSKVILIHAERSDTPRIENIKTWTV